MTTISVKCFTEHWWTEAAKKLKRSLLFIDSEAAECLHWSGGGLARILDVGIVDVKEFSSFETGGKDDKKAVFILSGPVSGLRADILGEIVKNSHFEYVTVLTNASPAVHKVAKYPGKEVEEQTMLGQVEDQVLEWMGHFDYTCEVFYYPIHTISICDDFFVMPAFSRLFPLLSWDLSRARDLWQKVNNQPGMQPSSATQTSPSNSGESEIIFGLLPYELQVGVRHFVSSLNSIFQMLNIREDIFTVGSFSRLLGEQLELLQAARNRRKTAVNKTSLILIDRTLDLRTPTSLDMDKLFDKIKSSLPDFPCHTNDVQVDMAPLFGVETEQTRMETFPSGSIGNSFTRGSNTNEKPADKLLKMMVEGKEDQVYKCLHDILAEKIENVKDRDGEVTVDELENVLDSLSNNVNLIKANLSAVQRTRACVEAARSSTHVKFKLIREMYERYKKTFSKKKELRSFLLQISKLVRTRKQRGLTLDDILFLLIHLYSSLPKGEEFYPEDEDRLQSALSEAFVKDKLSSNMRVLTKDDTVDEIMAYQTVKKIFAKLHSIANARSGLKGYQEMDSSKGFLEVLMDDIFADDRRDVVDLEHRSGGLGGLLKTGIGLFGVSMNKMHPRENPSVWVFVVGGLTAAEESRIRTLVRERSQCELVIGSTKMLSPEQCVKSVFVDDPLLLE